MVSILLVDDEEPSRNRMRFLLNELNRDINIIGEAENGQKAIEKVLQLNPELLILDIQMPVLDGFEVANMLGDKRPSIVFVTAYDEYALDAFEVHAVDYLMKPVRKQRLQKALDHFDDQQHIKKQAENFQSLMNSYEIKKRFPLKKLPVVNKQEILLLDLDKINYIEADGNFTWAYVDEKRYRTDFSLKDLEQRLADSSYLRIHRSHMVNLSRVHKLEPWFKDKYRLKLINGTELDVARRRVSDLKEKLGMT